MYATHMLRDAAYDVAIFPPNSFDIIIYIYILRISNTWPLISRRGTIHSFQAHERFFSLGLQSQRQLFLFERVARDLACTLYGSLSKSPFGGDAIFNPPNAHDFHHSAACVCYSFRMWSSIILHLHLEIALALRERILKYQLIWSFCTISKVYVRFVSKKVLTANVTVRKTAKMSEVNDSDSEKDKPSMCQMAPLMGNNETFE